MRKNNPLLTIHATAANKLKDALQTLYFSFIYDGYSHEEALQKVDNHVLKVLEHFNG